jgi:hypothetical protein
VAGCNAIPLPPSTPAKESCQKQGFSIHGIDSRLMFFTSWFGVPNI